MSKISFNLNGIKIKLNNGSSIEEISNMLQNLTSDHLYIESGVLKGVNDPINLLYGRCNLLQIDQGYLLEEKNTNRQITVFSKKLMEFLTSKCSESSSSDEYFFPEKIKQCFSSTENFNSLSKNLNEIEVSEPKIPIEKIEKTFFEAEFTDFQKYESSIEETSDFSKENSKKFFRMFIKSVDDQDNQEIVCINPKVLKNLEEENENNIEETIILSFTSFLEMENYLDPKVSLVFDENVFGEVLIETENQLNENIIEKIEKEALLPINDDEVIFFISKDTSFSSNTSKEENVYSENVPISRLPLELKKITIDKTKFVPNVEDMLEFSFNDSRFLIKNEGGDFFSLFDLELYFHFSHLHPKFYYNFSNYGDLPIAQFQN
jgi:hypothetical protein